MRAIAKLFYVSQVIGAAHLGTISDIWADFAVRRIKKISDGETIAGDVAAWCLGLLVVVLWVAVILT